MSDVATEEPKQPSLAEFGRGFRDFQKQMLQFQKSTFDSSFETFVAFQDQQGKLFADLVERTDSLPDEGRELVTEWVNTSRRGREEYKAAVDKSYDLMVQYFERLGETAQDDEA